MDLAKLKDKEELLSYKINEDYIDMMLAKDAYELELEDKTIPLFIDNDGYIEGVVRKSEPSELVVGKLIDKTFLCLYIISKETFKTYLGYNTEKGIILLDQDTNELEIGAIYPYRREITTQFEEHRRIEKTAVALPAFVILNRLKEINEYSSKYDNISPIEFKTIPTIKEKPLKLIK